MSPVAAPEHLGPNAECQHCHAKFMVAVPPHEWRCPDCHRLLVMFPAAEKARASGSTVLVPAKELARMRERLERIEKAARVVVAVWRRASPTGPAIAALDNVLASGAEEAPGE